MGAADNKGIDTGRATVWSTKLRSFQRELDRDGADRQCVARVAGALLDLAEDIERECVQGGGSKCPRWFFGDRTTPAMRCSLREGHPGDCQ